MSMFMSMTLANIDVLGSVHACTRSVPAVLYVHVNVACPCPFCMFVSMSLSILHVHVQAECLRPCCMSNVHAAFL
jgi:hypothetical protein